MPKVHHRERCPPNAKLQAAYDEYERSGPCDIVIVTGRRVDAEQLAEYRKGRAQLASGQWMVIDRSQVVTEAKTAKQSAHGHDAGADNHPVRELFPGGAVKLIWTGNEADPAERAQAIALLEQVCDWVDAHPDLGIETGRHFPGLADRPHWQDKEWQTLPLAPGVSA